VFAQPDIDIEEVQVISLQIPVAVDESGRSVSIITEKEIEDSPFTSIDELLRTVPGLNINSRGGFGVQSDVGMRGSTFSQVLILIDGVRYSEPLTAHLNFSLPIPLSEISKIEVIRGPASALYGADAVGGIIHIHTKARRQQGDGFRTSGYGFYGEQDLFDGDVTAAYHFGKATISAGYKSVQSNGQSFTNPNFTAGVSEVETFRTDFDIESFTIATNIQPSEEWNIHARYAQDERDFNAKYFYTRSTFDESREATSAELAQVSIDRMMETNATHLSLGYRQGEDVFAFNPAFLANQHETERIIGLARHQFTVGEENTIGFGAQFETQEIESNDRGNHDQQFLEGFATGLFHLTDELTTMISARVGDHEVYGTNFTPQASISYNQDRYILRSSAGWAIRGADFTERYVSDLIPDLSPGRNIGNPLLDAEHSFTGDVGFTYLASPSATLSATVFHRSSSNLIDFVLTNSNSIETADNLQANEDYFYSRNIADAHTTGVEFYTDLLILDTDASSIDVHVNYTFLSTEIEDGLRSKYLANHPNHQINTVLSARFGRFSTNLVSQWIDRDGEAVEQINAAIPDDYFVTHFKAGYKLTDHFSARLRMFNMFDEGYQEILGSQMPERWVSGGVQWSF